MDYFNEFFVSTVLWSSACSLRLWTSLISSLHGRYLVVCLLASLIVLSGSDISATWGTLPTAIKHEAARPRCTAQTGCWHSDARERYPWTWLEEENTPLGGIEEGVHPPDELTGKNKNSISMSSIPQPGLFAASFSTYCHNLGSGQFFSCF